MRAALFDKLIAAFGNRTRTAITVFTAMIILPLLSACGNADAVSAGGNNVAASMVISPATAAATAGSSLQFTAVVKNSDGETIPAHVTWEVLHGGGHFDTTGMFTADTVAGVFVNSIHVTAGAVSLSNTLTIMHDTAVAFSISVPSADVPASSTHQFAATAKDKYNNAWPQQPVWSVVNGGGTIDTAGIFTAGPTTGMYANTVKATYNQFTSTSSVNVTPGALASITVSPSPVNVAIGGTQQFTAVGHDASNNVVAFNPTWSVVNGGGTISAGGQFTAGNTAATYANTVKVASGTVSALTTVNVTSGALASITLTPATTSLASGATQQYTAVGHDAGNNVVAFTPTWSVVNGGGSINSTGLFTAGNTAGTYTNTVKVASGSVSATASATVTPGLLVSISLTPATVTVVAGTSLQLLAIGKDANNNSIVLTPTFSVTNGGGSITSTGMFTAGTTAGNFANTIHVQSGAISATATVNVLAGTLSGITITAPVGPLSVGGTLQFTATGHDINNNPLPITPTWSVTAGGSIDASGLYTAGNLAGTFNASVKATVGAVSATANVSILPGVLSTITVTPSVLSLVTGATQQLTAVGHDAFNNVVAITPTWSVVGSAGVVNGTGLFTAGITAGTFLGSVHASVGAVVGTSDVTVLAGLLNSITVSPVTSLVVGATQQLVAVGHDIHNNVVAITPTWSVTGGAGVVNGSGLFTAGITAGTFLGSVHASVGAVVGNGDVSLVAGALSTISITPTVLSLVVGTTQQLTAIGKDVHNNVVAITPTWSVVGGAGTVDGNGMFTAGVTVGTFLGGVHASVGGIVGTRDVTLLVGALTSIAVSSVNSLVVGATQQLTAVGHDAYNNVVAITPTWSIVGSAGTINGSGLFTAGITAGTFLGAIHASAGGVVGTGDVSLIAGLLSSITVTPSTVSLLLGGTQHFTAVGHDIHNNVVAITPVWSIVGALGGVIDSVTGIFVSGGLNLGLFTNSIKATVGAVSGTASVTLLPVGP